jgi:protein ImuB
MRTLFLECPDWPVVAAAPAVDQPSAVIFANRVVAASRLARDAEVFPGLRRRESQARCPSLLLLEHDPARDARAFEKVAGALDDLCPRIEIVGPGQLAFATRGPSRYWGGDQKLVARTLAVVMQAHPGWELTAMPAVGIADSRFAAQLAAQYGKSPATVVDDTAAFLAALPIDCVGAELGAVLSRLGLRTLGHLANLARADVIARFGPEGDMAHRLACGEEDRPLDARTPPPDLVAAIEFDPPALAMEQVAFASKQLADQLHGNLAERGLACTRVAIEVETEHGEHRCRLWRHQGALSAAAMAERVRWQLDGWINGPALSAPSGGITLLRLVPDEVLPDRGRQLGFWGGQTDADVAAGLALVRLGAQLGRNAVLVVEPAGGRGPADRFTLTPSDMVDPLRRIDGDGASYLDTPPWPGQLPRPSPMLVHDPPLLAEVVDASGSLLRIGGRADLSGDPAQWRTLGSAAGDRPGPWFSIMSWAGPWCADERWWDERRYRRRARLQVVDKTGAAHLLTVEGSVWGVEATYD